MVALTKLYELLAPEAQVAFAPLFKILHLRNVNNTSPLVMGDTDGSTVRTIVAGLIHDNVDIDEKRIAILAQVMNAEGKMLDRIRRDPSNENRRIEFSAFQTNQTIQDQIAEIAAHLTYKKGDENRKLIFIGDVVHDRCSCNRDADRLIREKLAEQGVIFIRGNHDVFERNPQPTYHWGTPAYNTGSFDEWKLHEAKVFQNAYNDAAAKTIYLHHGLQKVTVDGVDYIATAFSDRYKQKTTTNGYLFPCPKKGDTFDSEAFVKWVNGLDPSNLDEFTDFRPNDYQMQLLAAELGITIVHGHNGCLEDGGPNLVILNSLDRNLSVIVSAAYVGELTNTTSLGILNSNY